MTVDNSGSVGIGAAPFNWFSGKILQIDGARPILRLNSSGALSTLLFTNQAAYTESHTGEFHVNHFYNSDHPDKSQLTFYSYPGEQTFMLQADGNVSIQANKQYRLRCPDCGETAIGYDAASETVRLSHTKDATNRFISLGGYSSGTWNPQLTVNTSNGRVGINTTSPAYQLDVNGTINATQVLVNGQPLSALGGDVWNIENSSINYTAGTVAIGTNYVPNDYKLAVEGKIISHGVKVQMRNEWPDYVFDNQYQLPRLSEVKKFIRNKGHLPNVPSAAEVKQNGIDLGEMNATLLKKVEELTLYVIQQGEQLEKQNQQIETLKREVNKLKH